MAFHHFVNTRYFSEAAIDWKKNGGRYTLAPEGSREYFQYWEEQERRCKYGYKVGDLYVTGRHYGYLNFFPISRVPDSVMMKALEQSRGKRGAISVRTAEKVMEFPAFWEIDYEWWNFKQIAWHGGVFMGIKSPGGKHMGCLKTRGAGFSYKEAWDGIYNYNFIDGSKNYYFASAEPYLIGDAILDKVQTGLDFMNANSSYWKKNRQKKFTLMHQKASYIDGFGVEKGTMSEIIGQIVDKPGKAHPYSANIITPDGPKKWADIQKGSRIFGSDGKVIQVEETFELGEQDIYTVEFNDGRKVNATLDHLWNVSKWHTRQKALKEYTFLLEETIDTREIIRRLNLKTAPTNPQRVKIGGCTNYPNSLVPLNAYTLGLMLGDGSIGNTTKNLSYLTMMHEDIDAISHLIPYKVEREKWGTGIRNKIHIPDGKNLFKRLNLFDKRSGTKFIPDIYKYNSKEVRLGVINGLLDTDGSVTRDFGIIEYSTKSKQLAEDFIWVIHSLGYGGTIKSRLIKGCRYYRCYVYAPGGSKELFNLPRKKALISRRKGNAKAVNITQYLTIKSVTYSHKEQAKCIQVDAKDHLYLIEDHIITHNTRGKRGRKVTFEEAGTFPGLEAALEVSLGSLREGSIYVGQASVFGTGGETGPAIQGLENIFNAPEAWDMLAFPNIWEDGMYGSQCGYFVPCYRANAWRMDENGNVDIPAALDDDDRERAKKELTGRPKDLDRRKAEYPRTPAEALQRLSGNGFNIAELDKQIKRIESSRAVQGFIRHGKLVASDTPEVSLGGIEFIPQPKNIARPIEDYPHKPGDDLTGCVSIIERPWTDQNGMVPRDMYLVTFDSYYKDESQDVTSLFSIKVWKQENPWSLSYIDLPVAWATMRPKDLNTVYFILFALCRYYNCSAQGEISGGGQGVVNYARLNKLLDRLYHEPDMAHNKDQASKAAGQSYLMNMGADRKKMGLQYLEDWHVQPRGVDEKGSLILNVHQIYDIAFLREMRKHDPERGNYDRISDATIAMFMLKERRAHLIKDRRERKGFYSRTLFGGSSIEDNEMVPMY